MKSFITNPGDKTTACKKQKIPYLKHCCGERPEGLLICPRTQTVMVPGKSRGCLCLGPGPCLYSSGTFFSGSLDPEPEPDNDNLQAHYSVILAFLFCYLASRGNRQELKMTGRTLQMARCKPQRPVPPACMPRSSAAASLSASPQPQRPQQFIIRENFALQKIRFFAKAPKRSRGHKADECT